MLLDSPLLDLRLFSLLVISRNANRAVGVSLGVYGHGASFMGR